MGTNAITSPVSCLQKDTDKAASSFPTGKAIDGLLWRRLMNKAIFSTYMATNQNSDGVERRSKIDR
jgi:hypothetical protein